MVVVVSLLRPSWAAGGDVSSSDCCQFIPQGNRIGEREVSVRNCKREMPIIKEERLTRNLDTASFDSVKKQVVGGIYEDWKRDTVDNAKKRAIYNSRNYDDFKSLVAGCTDRRHPISLKRRCCSCEMRAV